MLLTGKFTQSLGPHSRGQRQHSFKIALLSLREEIHNFITSLLAFVPHERHHRSIDEFNLTIRRWLWAIQVWVDIRWAILEVSKNSRQRNPRACSGSWNSLDSGVGFNKMRRSRPSPDGSSNGAGLANQQISVPSTASQFTGTPFPWNQLTSEFLDDPAAFQSGIGSAATQAASSGNGSAYERNATDPHWS